MIINQLPGRNIFFENQEFLYFSGTSYLGMGRQPLFEEVLREGINRYGTIFSVSRYNNLQLDVYRQAETYLARWTGAEAGVTVSSGMLAGQLAAKYFSDREFIYAPGVHPAIWKDGHLGDPGIYPTFQDWAKDLSNWMKPGARTVIALNAVDPLYCETYDYDWVLSIPDHADVVLLIDDSHGLGIMGEAGSGIFRTLQDKISNRQDIKLTVVASLAKALGIPGGVILSDWETIQGVVKSPLFGGATPVVPAYLYALMESTSLYENARRALQKNIRLFQTGTINIPGFRYIDQYPVFFIENNQLYDRLLKEKIFISHFSYPTLSSPSISRIILSALHTPEDIEKLIRTLNYGAPNA